VQRSLAKEAIVIVDAMNYIKGSRYQMYCEAREVGVRTCTVRSGGTPHALWYCRSSFCLWICADKAIPLFRSLSRLRQISAANATPPDQTRPPTLPRRTFPAETFFTFEPEKKQSPRSCAYLDSSLGGCRLDNLISRFEEPQSAARWDAPLFTIATDDPPFDTPSPATTTQTGGGDDTVPLGSTEAERIWTAITEGVIKPSTVATQQVSEPPSHARF
jgi:protein KTI12